MKNLQNRNLLSSLKMDPSNVMIVLESAEISIRIHKNITMKIKKKNIAPRTLWLNYKATRKELGFLQGNSNVN